MKKFAILLLSLLLITSIAGCGAKEKVEQKAAEKVIEKTTGDKVDVNGDKVTVQGDDGTKATIGGSDWPASNLGKAIPVFKDGSIKGVVDSTNYTMIILEKVNEDDFTNYKESIKKDFAADVYEVKAEEAISYSAVNANGIRIQLTYQPKDQTLTIAASQQEK